MHLKKKKGEFQVANFISHTSIPYGINFALFYFLISKVMHEPFQYFAWLAQFMDIGFACFLKLSNVISLWHSFAAWLAVSKFWDANYPDLFYFSSC